MVGTFIITSAAYAGPDFVSTFGLLPPAFLPVGNKRLYQSQANLISHLKCRKFLSIPSNFDIPENELANISDLGFELIKVPLELSLGASVANVLKQAELTEGELRILHGDTLVRNFPFEDFVTNGYGSKNLMLWCTPLTCNFLDFLKRLDDFTVCFLYIFKSFSIIFIHHFF